MDILQIHTILTIKLPEQAAQGFINTINETTHQTINSFTDITNKSINGVTESVDQANHVLSKLTDEAKQSLTDSLGKTANNVSQITNTTVGALSEKAKQAGDSLSATGQNLVNSVEDKLQKVEQFGTTISTEIERSINSLINHQLENIRHWIDVHPVISWMIKFLTWSINHPLIGLIAILLILFSIWQLFKAFSRLLEKGLLATLTAPFKLLTRLFKFSWKPGTFLLGNYQDAETVNSEDKQARLSKLLSRLEAIKIEQNDILQEISTIVSANTNSM
ncbi:MULTISPECIES: hypothetical protein [unclassified Anabaena]|uniref:hypothetical protein n=1 Tax=unclassified Anabaena TaxID=2619674 RepID=UPI00083092CB|nr:MULTISPECIES: hypothetical protein [unclassified Anabaena]